MKKAMIILGLVMVFVVSHAVYAASKSAIVEEKCKDCHSTSIIYNKKKDEAGWDRTYQRMVGHGLKATADEEKKIKAFLYTLK